MSYIWREGNKMKKEKPETYICLGCNETLKVGKVCLKCHPEVKDYK